MHTEAATVSSTYDAVVQGLDRKVGGLTFGSEWFHPTLDIWSGKPVVFSKWHPNPLKDPRDVNSPRFGVDPAFTEAELARLNGAIIGELKDARIPEAGDSRMEIKEEYSIEPALRMFEAGLISEDTLERSKAALPIALELKAQRRLGQSTAFLAPDDGEKLTGPVDPNHHLNFELTPVDKPVDPLTMFLNKQENENVTEPAVGNPHLNIGKAISAKNKAKLQGILDTISEFWQVNFGEGEPTPKTNQEIVATTGTMNTPGGESLESQIENVRRALSDHIGLMYPDGTKRPVWAVMTMPDKIIWQHPDTSQYYATPYTVVGDGAVTFGQPEEVEQAYVVKEANTVITNMTAEDLETISKRNKMAEPTTKVETDAAIAKLQKEKDDAIATKDAEIAKLQKERDDLKAEQEKVKLQKEDADWAELKKTFVKPGLLKDPEAEPRLRKLQKEDNAAFIKEVFGNRPAPTKAEGQTHVQKSGDPDTEDPVAKQNRILGTKTHIPGRLH